MFIKALQQGAKTDEEYREKLRARIRIDFFMCGVGLLTIAVAIVMMLRGGEYEEGFLCGVFMGTGAAVIIFAVKEILKAKKLLKNEKLLREERLKVSDERNKMINEKTSYWAGMIVMGVCYAVLLISGFFNFAVFWTAWGVLMLYFLVTVIVKKYYEKKL